MTNADLKRIERDTFRAAMDTGLWDIFLASFFAIFAIAPHLSVHLGDWWSAAVFVPVWVLVYVIIRIVHTRVVIPRVGLIEVGARRRGRMKWFTSIMLVANVVVFAVGIYAATRATPGQGPVFPYMFSLMLLLMFSTAAYFLDIPRFFFYGVLLAGAPLVGEELWQRGYVSHHGFPVVFGVAATFIFVSGLVRFWRILPRKMAGSEELPLEENDG